MKKMMIICISLFFSCGTLTKDKLLGKHKVKESLAQESKETLLTESAFNIKDSSHAMVEFTIWPRGVFKFNPVTGFEGEAFKMKLKGKHYQSIQQSRLASLKKEAITKQKLQQESVSKQQQKRVSWEGMAYGIGLLLLAVIAVVFWYVKQKLM